MAQDGSCRHLTILLPLHSFTSVVETLLDPPSCKGAIRRSGRLEITIIADDDDVDDFEALATQEVQQDPRLKLLRRSESKNNPSMTPCQHSPASLPSEGREDTDWAWPAGCYDAQRNCLRRQALEAIQARWEEETLALPSSRHNFYRDEWLRFDDEN